MSLDVALVIQNCVRRDGQGRVMVELAWELVRRGHLVTVYAHRIDEALADAVELVAIPPARGPQLVDDMAMLRRATRAVGARDHDVACVLGHTALPACPTVLNVQFSHQGWRESWRLGGRPGFRYRLHTHVAARLERRCVERADHIIASTPVIADEVAPARAGERPVPVSVVGNGVDLDEFTPVESGERRRARSECGFGSDEFVIGFLGDYATPRKGLEPLLQALTRGDASERLLVAARGDDGGTRARADALGVSERVVLAGFAPPRSVLAACDVLAVPSLYEPFGLVALEAAACGVPVVLSARAGVAPWLDGACVLVADPSDTGELRQALDHVRALKAGPRREMTEAARRLALQRSWAQTTTQAADIVEAVATQDREPARA